MSGLCRICLGDVDVGGDYHSTCVHGLFGTRATPRLEIAVGKLHTAALAMVGRTSLSGVQKKISVNLSASRETLQVAAGTARYILKPPTEAYPALPENEHVTTRLAQLVDIEVGRFGMIALHDGSNEGPLAFIARRFDRLPDGRKLRQEDFCQLSRLSPKEKYASTAERCMKLVETFASEPPVEKLKLFRLMVFAWWTGNGDMHLKNFSLLVDEGGIVRLTPAYDLVCTRLVIADDPLALSVCGKKDNLNRKLWLQFAEHSRIAPRAAVRVLDNQIDATEASAALIDRCFLPDEMKQNYRSLIAARTQKLRLSR